MNMLTNKVPFGLLSESEKQLFRDSVNSCDYYTEAGVWNKWNNAGALTQDVVLRMKLKEGRWYTTAFGIHQLIKIDENEYVAENDNEKRCIDWFEIESFRPATKEEIDRVKPQETFVDLAIEWKAGIATIDANELGYTACDLVKPSEFKDGRRCYGEFTHSWHLTCFKYENSRCETYPIRWHLDGTGLKERATHARFVKVVE